MKILHLISGICLSAVIIGCSAGNEREHSIGFDTPTPITTPQNVVTPPADGNNLGDQMLRLIGRNCVSCHSGDEPSGNLDLTKVENIVMRSQDIASSILNGTMPPDGPLSEEELALVRAWQAAGFPAPSAGQALDVRIDGNGDGQQQIVVVICQNIVIDDGDDKKKKKKKKEEEEEDKNDPCENLTVQPT